MDTGKTDIKKETREITRAGVYASAGPKQLDISRKGQEPDALPYGSLSGGSKKYAYWGSNNRYPDEVVDLNAQDTTSSACLNFKTKAHYGKGLMLYTPVIDADGHETKVPLDIAKYPEIEEFFFRSDIENLQQGTIADFEFWNWTVTELIPDKNKKKILYANRIPTIHCRPEIQSPETGLINHMYVSGEFGSLNLPAKPAEISIFDKRKFNYNSPNIPKKVVHVAKQSSVNRTYFPLPAWQSNNKFLNLSLEISDWILSNINNSINIKYHIEYPESYFNALCPSTAYDKDKDWLAAKNAEKQKLFGEIDEYLAGTGNVGKYIHTYTMRDPMDPSKEIGFKIHVIENKTNHEAYLPAFDTSAAAIANAHNAPLSLVGLSLSKGMAGSGSDVREQFNFYMQLHTEIPRQTTLEWLYNVKRINKWPKEVHFGYKNIVFQSVDQNKSGYAVENEAKPTSANK